MEYAQVPRSLKAIATSERVNPTPPHQKVQELMADEIDPALLEALMTLRPQDLRDRRAVEAENGIPFPSGFGWDVGRERLQPWEQPHPAELRAPGKLPEPYVESRLNEQPIGVHTALPGSLFKVGAALPGILVQGGKVGGALADALSSPMTAAGAGLATDELAGLAARGAVKAAPYALDAADKAAATVLGTAAHAEGLPHEKWFTPQGTLKIGPSSSPEEIKAMQSFLQASGDYKGPIDGIWKGKTADAANLYAGRIRQDFISSQAAEKAKAEAATASANQAAEKAKADTAAAARARADADAEKFGKFADDYRAQHPVYSFAHEHPLITALGVGVPSFVLGLGGQRVLAEKFGMADQALAKEARAAVGRAGKADVNTGAGRGERATELNKWWDMGGADAVPFERGGKAWVHNSAAPDAATLYQVGTGKRLGRESLAATLSGGLEGSAELIGGTERMHFFQKQLDDAKADLDKGFTPERARAVLDAENNLATFQAVQRGSIGAFLASAGGVGKGMVFPEQPPPTKYGTAARLREELADRIPKKKP